jgi:hypothetical protein
MSRIPEVTDCWQAANRWPLWRYRRLSPPKRVNWETRRGIINGVTSTSLLCISLMLMLGFILGRNVYSASAVLQRGYDPAVSGVTLSETSLNSTNVTPATFGLLRRLPVDDAIYAQPLYVPNVRIPNQGTHNVVYVSTMSDVLYAFDGNTANGPLWSVNFASRVGAMPVPIAKYAFSSNRNIIGNLGILSTPVIDPVTHTLYLVACTLERNTLVYRLHAVDITNGAEPYGPGVVISGSHGGAVFDARYQTQRMSLTLVGEQVVFGFGALEQEYPGGYVGWVMAYNKRTLQQSGVFATVTAGNRGGGVWQSGRPPAVDSAGFVYVFVGNGFGSGYDGLRNFNESILKLNPTNGLQLVDWFTPGNWSWLDAQDLDLTSSGPLQIPGTSLIAGGGKTGELYVLNTRRLGKFNATDSQVTQKERISASEIRGGPVYWKRSAENGGSLLYNWGVDDWVKAFPFSGAKLGAAPSSQGSRTQIYPGGILALSANGEASGSGVLWATIATSGDAKNNPPVPGALVAFDAENVARELWNSATTQTHDGYGNLAKFVPPLIADGKVFVATASNQVAVYGLLSQLTVTKAGSGVGSIASSPTRIHCGSICSARLATGSPVKLVATAAAHSTFSGWGAGCSARGKTCILNLNSATTIKATFNRRARSRRFVSFGEEKKTTPSSSSRAHPR